MRKTILFYRLGELGSLILVCGLATVAYRGKGSYSVVPEASIRSLTSSWLGPRCVSRWSEYSSCRHFLRERCYLCQPPMESMACLYSVQRVVFCPKRPFVPTQFLSVGSCCVVACCVLCVGPFRIDSSPWAHVVDGYAALPLHSQGSAD